MIQNSLPEEFLVDFTEKQVSELKQELSSKQETEKLLQKVDEVGIEKEKRREKIKSLHQEDLNKSAEQEAYEHLEGLIKRNSGNLTDRVLESIFHELEFIYEQNDSDLYYAVIHLLSLYNILDDNINEMIARMNARFSEV
jgi:RNA processing factor Prp31